MQLKKIKHYKANKKTNCKLKFEKHAYKINEIQIKILRKIQLAKFCIYFENLKCFYIFILLFYFLIKKKTFILNLLAMLH